MASDFNIIKSRVRETHFDPRNPAVAVYHNAGVRIFEIQQLLGFTKRENMSQEIRTRLLEMKAEVERVRANAEGEAIEVYAKELYDE